MDLFLLPKEENKCSEYQREDNLSPWYRSKSATYKILKQAMALNCYRISNFQCIETSDLIAFLLRLVSVILQFKSR